MNTTDKFPIDESEWAAQERGMRAARGCGEGAADAATSSYRAVAVALATAPHDEPPADFATVVAQHVARRDARFERRLSRVLLVVFAAASIMVGLRYGEPWWQSLQRAFGDDALGWMLAGVGCMALSWMFSRLLGLASPETAVFRART